MRIELHRDPAGERGVRGHLDTIGRIEDKQPSPLARRSARHDHLDRDGPLPAGQPLPQLWGQEVVDPRAQGGRQACSGDRLEPERLHPGKGGAVSCGRDPNVGVGVGGVSGVGQHRLLRVKDAHADVAQESRGPGEALQRRTVGGWLDQRPRLERQSLGVRPEVRQRLLVGIAAQER